MEEPSFLKIFKTLFGKQEHDLEDLTPDEEAFFKELLSLRGLEVADFLIPRNLIKSLDLSLPWEEVRNFVITHPYTYYPVYSGTLDHYKGYLRLIDLIRGFNFTIYNWQDFVKPAVTFPENLPILTALRRLREQELDLAFVVDELSELIGIIRTEDVFKELFFSPKRCVRADPEGWITLSGTTKIHLIERCLGISFPEGDYETLAGFILDNLNRIPQRGEKFSLPPLEIEILDANEKQIKEVRIKRIP